MKTLLDKESLVFNQPELGCVLSLPELPGGSSKIHDRSPYANIGTITGATWKRLPSGLWCLSFDGTDDKVTITDHPSLNMTHAVTFEYWLKANSGYGETYPRIFEKGGANQYSSRITSATGLLNFHINIAGTDRTLNLSSALATDVWKYLAFTFDGTTRKLFLNATIDNEDSTYTGSIGIQASDLQLGDDGTGTRVLDGSIALMRIHNRDLSALELQNHFNREKHLFGVW